MTENYNARMAWNCRYCREVDWQTTRISMFFNVPHSSGLSVKFVSDNFKLLERPVTKALPTRLSHTRYIYMYTVGLHLIMHRTFRLTDKISICSNHIATSFSIMLDYMPEICQIWWHWPLTFHCKTAMPITHAIKFSRPSVWITMLDR